jgi:hypothetical protein
MSAWFFYMRIHFIPILLAPFKLWEFFGLYLQPPSNGTMPTLQNSEQATAIQNNHPGPETNSTTTWNTEKIYIHKMLLRQKADAMKRKTNKNHPPIRRHDRPLSVLRQINHDWTTNDWPMASVQRGGTTRFLVHANETK